jgi:hypothetical protein
MICEVAWITVFLSFKKRKFSSFYILESLESMDKDHIEMRKCAAEAIFCCTTENSHHLARCHVTSEKSSKNYISLFQESPPEGYPRHPPHLSASRYRTFSMCWTASAVRECDFYSRESLAGGEGGGRGDLRNGAIR